VTAPAKRIVRCFHCRGMMRVSAKALSVFCPHCQKRVMLEDIHIAGSHPGKSLATCGDVYVERTAKLNVAIFASRVFVDGRVRGPITAGHTVEVGATGYVVGDIEAPRIVVREGGVIEGRCRMTPTAPQKAPSQPDPPTDDEAMQPTQPRASCSEQGGQAFQPRPLRRPGSPGA